MVIFDERLPRQRRTTRSDYGDFCSISVGTLVLHHQAPFHVNGTKVPIAFRRFSCKI